MLEENYNTQTNRLATICENSKLIVSKQTAKKEDCDDDEATFRACSASPSRLFDGADLLQDLSEMSSCADRLDSILSSSSREATLSRHGDDEEDDDDDEQVD